jgi:hypothetical protein
MSRLATRILALAAMSGILLIGADPWAHSIPFSTPEGSLCMEDEPCFRSDAPGAPLYMKLPKGAFWDQFAPMLGYHE